MRLTMMTDYAMRLLMYVAQRPERLCTIAEVARAYDISEAHLMKVTHQLGLAGWIETVRGKGGGMRLAHRPEDINVGAVVRRMESDFQITECFGKTSNCSLTGTCGLTGVLNEALQAFLERLDSHTLADVLPPVTGAPLIVGERPLRRTDGERAA
ncbi:MAG: Rrf2 family transcriptional regulator [Burkholderiaceae bacterium]|jgi:Rrf2 family nitric oxide-sensitive transcriptional repressor|nr:Rrf2 family transcriptional regulator [Burkholderiaceae bacterium]